MWVARQRRDDSAIYSFLQRMKREPYCNLLCLLKVGIRGTFIFIKIILHGSTRTFSNDLQSGRKSEEEGRMGFARSETGAHLVGRVLDAKLAYILKTPTTHCDVRKR
jgi:hypothetical protein